MKYKQKRNIFLATVILLSKFIVFAQDTSYVKESVYKDNIRISTGFINQHINLYSKAHGKVNSVIEPNVNNTLRFAINWRFVSLSYATQIPNLYFKPAIYGNTKYNDFSLNFFKRKMGWQIYYRTYDGFFMQETNSTPVVIRPDVYLLQTGINLLFFTNHKRFSFRAAFSQNRRQLKSAGGFILMPELGYKKLVGDFSFIQKTVDNSYNYDIYQGMNRISFAVFELRPGYAYNFIFKGGKWYICPFAAFGGGISLYNIETNGTHKFISGWHSDFTFRLSAGYDNGKRFFANITYATDVNANYLTKSVVLNHSSFNFFLTGGLRFGKR